MKLKRRKNRNELLKHPVHRIHIYDTGQQQKLAKIPGIKRKTPGKNYWLILIRIQANLALRTPCYYTGYIPCDYTG